MQEKSSVKNRHKSGYLCCFLPFLGKLVILKKLLFLLATQFLGLKIIDTRKAATIAPVTTPEDLHSMLPKIPKNPSSIYPCHAELYNACPKLEIRIVAPAPNLEINLS